MFPREHGAYGQLLFPLIAALAIGRPGAAALAWTAAAVCAFLAHEPLRVLLGQRGRRAAREERGRAMRWFAAFASAAAAAGALAVVLMAPTARAAVPLVVPSAVLVALVVLAGRLHTAAGEVLAAAALSSLAWPAALAAGAAPIEARSCVAAFVVVFATATIAVHAVIARTQKPPATAERTVAVIVAMAGPAVLWTAVRAGAILDVAAVAALPMAGLAAVLAAAAPPARRLRPVGWTLVVASAATAIVFVGGLRAS